MQVRVDLLNEGRFSSTGHAYCNDNDRLLLFFCRGRGLWLRLWLRHDGGRGAMGHGAKLLSDLLLALARPQLLVTHHHGPHPPSSLNSPRTSMDTSPYPRGRGGKTNGHSHGGPRFKNKQWIAGQSTSSRPKSRESSIPPTDGARWERGGGPKRGRGRGRGSSRTSTPPAAPAFHQEVTYHTDEDEGHDARYPEEEVDGTEEDAVSENEYNDPDTPEERERLYQEVSPVLLLLS